MPQPHTLTQSEATAESLLDSLAKASTDSQAETEFFGSLAKMAGSVAEAAAPLAGAAAGAYAANQLGGPVNGGAMGPPPPPLPTCPCTPSYWIMPG